LGEVVMETALGVGALKDLSSRVKEDMV